MASEVASILTAGLGIAEIAVCSLAALGVYRHWGHTLAEAAAGAALLPAILMSFVLQAVYLTGFSELIPPLRLTVLVVAVVLIWRHRAPIHGLGRPFWRFFRDQPWAVGALGVTLGTLAAAAVLTGWHGGYFDRPPLSTTWPSSDGMPSPLKVTTGAVVCGSAFPGVVLLPWMAYLSICFATYALARRYAWPPTAITVTLLVASMPRLVFLSVSQGVEIIPAAAALLFILLLYRTVERPDIKDCLLLALVPIFSLSAGTMGLVFPTLGCGLALIVLFRRHGGRIWWDLARAAPLPVAAAGLALFSFAGVGLLTGWHWVGQGSSTAWAYNTDGILGAIANLLRYGLQVLDLTPPLEQVLNKALNWDWNGFRMWIHDHLLATLFHAEGLAMPFNPTVPGDLASAWFGPFAALLVLPALGWALLRGPRRLKSLALVLVAYLFLVALIPAWLPGNVRYFTVFFVCAGFTTAFLLPPWRMTRRRRRFFQVGAVALIAYAVGTVYQRM